MDWSRECEAAKGYLSEYDKGYQDGSRETAEKILQEFANIKVNGSSLGDYIVAVKVVNKIDELSKQFNIKIKE